MQSELLEAAWRCCDADEKCERVAAVEQTTELHQMLQQAAPLDQHQLEAGRPAAPQLISPRDVPRRGLGSEVGRAAMIHAIAHIEFNAINLALDAALRFAGMPLAYYEDWISVAKDEARHFGMLRGRLTDMGRSYGEFPAHNGLWEAAVKPADHGLARMALVPRVLEARGLDVTPQMIVRLKEVGDQASADILTVILEEEVRHVAIGTRWYRYLCEREGCEPISTFRALLDQHRVRRQKPFNEAARKAAGFEAEELIEPGQ